MCLAVKRQVTISKRNYSGTKHLTRRTKHYDASQDFVCSADMGTGHFFGHASNPTHLRLTRDPTRPGFIKMQCVMLLCACKNNMKPLKHFIIALPMFNTRRNKRIHISYKSWTQYTRYVVKDQSHESSRQRDTCHYPFTQLSTNKSVRSCCLDDVD